MILNSSVHCPYLRYLSNFNISVSFIIQFYPICRQTRPPYRSHTESHVKFCPLGLTHQQKLNVFLINNRSCIQQLDSVAFYQIYILKHQGSHNAGLITKYYLCLFSYFFYCNYLSKCVCTLAMMFIPSYPGSIAFILVHLIGDFLPIKISYSNIG